MRIVIVGDGKVGYTLTERLSAEGHDIVVIDSDARNLQMLENALDVITVHGNGASAPVLREAGVEEANLLIAVTSMDEINMICCLTAKKLGAEHAVARVRNPDYAGQLMLLKEELGLSMAVNPELAAAREIARLLRHPSAMQIETFARGRAELVEYRIPEDSALCGTRLHEITSQLQTHILVCAVQRGDDVFIPTGDFALECGDHIHVTIPPGELTAFFKKLGVYQQRIKDVIIVGGGRIAYYLTKQVADQGMQVKIVERDPARAEELAELLPRQLIIEGDGTDPDLLGEEGIDQCDAFVALTGMDEENIILSMYAKTRTQGKVITKVDHLAYTGVLDGLGLDSLISPKDSAANGIVSLVRGMQNSLGSNVETMHELLEGRVEGLEFRIRENADFLGIPLKDLPLKKDLLIGCIVRKGRTIIPAGSDTIELGDSVVVITMARKYHDYNDIFARREPD